MMKLKWNEQLVQRILKGSYRSQADLLEEAAKLPRLGRPRFGSMGTRKELARLSGKALLQPSQYRLPQVDFTTQCS